MSLKDAIKSFAYGLGADLVGFGDIDRCRHAPPMMSPQGLYPRCRTIIVMGIHHPDACVELGGERHPQEIGPYSVQYLMNSRLDEMAYRLATFLERSGCGAMPIASSNIWRYNQYKDLHAVFAPDVSHIYMAVVAGLAELGFSGLALTPQYGARNRFITVLTDAELASDPLVPPGSVCDRCMLCRQHCPAQALSKELDGEKVLKIGPYEYRFPNKNLWRCSWGEHFDLDLDLEIPDVVDERVILQKAREHGIRSGEMGQCLKFCVPGPLRQFDRAYSRTPMRRYDEKPDSVAMQPAAIDRLLSACIAGGAEQVIVRTAQELRSSGIEPDRMLPGAQAAVTLLCTAPSDAGGSEHGAQYLMDSLCYDLTRGLEELGCRSLMTMERSSHPPDAARDANPTASILLGVDGLRGRKVFANTVITRMRVPTQARIGTVRRQLDAGDASAHLTGDLMEFARSLGADLVGVAGVKRLDDLAGQLAPFFEGDEILDAQNKAGRFTPWQPVVTARRRHVRRPGEWLASARSVLVVGLRLHKSPLLRATLPPAEAVGPYAYQTYITNWMTSVLGWRLMRRLEEFGYRAVSTNDLTGTDSLIASPRGPQPDLRTNRFAGLAAGLGSLTLSGHLASPQFGLRQRLLAIVTDAPLTESPLLPPQSVAQRCRQCGGLCVSACPSAAITEQSVELTCEGQRYTFRKTAPKRCDWARRYAILGDSGFKYLGSPLDIPCPADPTADELAAAMRQHDPIKMHRPVAAEPCIIKCPLAAGEP
jgi:epoxyqueuosine reductase QueG